MNPIKNILENNGIMIIDGAFSTELERRGCNINDALWSAKILMENPDIIKEVHKDYYQSGADCVITASYQATYEGFMKKGLSKEEAKHLMLLSVELAKSARDEFLLVDKNHKHRPYPLVAASIGPYGAFLADGSEYKGHYSIDKEALKEFHRERMLTLVSAKPDLLACETIPCLTEALSIAALMESMPHTYGWISFSAKDEQHINSGELISECAKALEGFESVVAIGINCTAPEYVSGLIAEIKANSTKPIIVYPNSGEHYDPVTKTWSGCLNGLSYGEYAKEWYEKGARLIGGCCRTKPSDIEAIVKWARI